MTYELKPYHAYRDSGVPWLGPLPEHWAILPGRACYREKRVSNKNMIEKTVLSLSYGQIVVKPVEKLHGLVPESFETYQIIEPGDIIVRPTDLQNDWTSLRFGLSPHRGIITSAYMCLHTKAAITRNYGYLLLHSYDLRKVFYGLGSGLRQNLDWRDFKYLPCLAPPISEQSAIVRFLDHVDRRSRRYILAKTKLIALLNGQKQAIIHRAVTRGLDPDVRLKPSGVEGLEGVPEHWEIAPLKSTAYIQSGLTLGKNYLDRESRKFPYLRVANVQAGHLDLETVKTVLVPEDEASRCTLQDGDVLMTEGGDPDKLGRGCVWEDKIKGCLHQNHIFAVRPRASRLLPHFLEALLGSHYAKLYFLRRAKQTTNLASTNKTTIGNLPLLLPSLDEQKFILDELSASTAKLREAIVIAGREIDLISEYRTRLIADVVTGKLDVREAAARLPEEPEAEDLSPAEDVESEAEEFGEDDDDVSA